MIKNTFNKIKNALSSYYKHRCDFNKEILTVQTDDKVYTLCGCEVCELCIIEIKNKEVNCLAHFDRVLKTELDKIDIKPSH